MSDVEVWQGDCRELMARIPEGTVEAVVADPPYGIDYQSAWRTDRSAWKPKIANDKEPFVAWLPEAFRVTKDGGALACFCVWQVQETFRVAIEGAGFTVRSQVIWDRDWHGMGDLAGEFGPQHDVIWFAVKGRFIFPGKRPKSVLRHARVAPDQLVHPNEKPLRLMGDLVKSLCPSDGLVVDPFAGSGTTGIACMKTGRRAILIEVEPRYISVIHRRLRDAATPLFDSLEATS
jgi:DNA modification methylase